MNKIGISLGMKCDAAIWGIETGLRKRKIEGYNTCPFDEMLSNYPGILQCLKDDFKYFCDTNYLKIIDTQDGPFIFNTKYKFAFNHESPGHDNLHIKQEWAEGINHFINNNYAHFIERYTKRINSFREYLLDPNNYIEFIIQRYNTFKIDLWELKDILLLHYPDLKLNFNVIFIDNIEARKVLKVLQFTENDEEMDRLNYWMDSPSYYYNNLLITHKYLHKKENNNNIDLLNSILDKLLHLENKFDSLSNKIINKNKIKNNKTYCLKNQHTQTDIEDEEKKEKKEEDDI